MEKLELILSSKCSPGDLITVQTINKRKHFIKGTLVGYDENSHGERVVVILSKGVKYYVTFDIILAIELPEHQIFISNWKNVKSDIRLLNLWNALVGGFAAYVIYNIVFYVIIPLLSK